MQLTVHRDTSAPEPMRWTAGARASAPEHPGAVDLSSLPRSRPAADDDAHAGLGVPRDTSCLFRGGQRGESGRHGDLAGAVADRDLVGTRGPDGPHVLARHAGAP